MPDTAQQGGSVPEAKVPQAVSRAVPQTVPQTTIQKDTHFRVLKLIEDNPQISQRELAGLLGVSLGKSNYLLKSLMDKGLVKIGNLARGDHKIKKIAYLLTAEGLQSRAAMTRDYLERKRQEYDALRQEIEALGGESEPMPRVNPPK